MVESGGGGGGGRGLTPRASREPSPRRLTASPISMHNNTRLLAQREMGEMEEEVDDEEDEEEEEEDEEGQWRLDHSGACMAVSLRPPTCESETLMSWAEVLTLRI